MPAESRAMIARLTTFCLGLATALLALMAGLIALQVGARNLFDVGLPWADELARFSSIGLVFLAVPLLAARGQLVAVSILPDACGPAMRRWLALLSDISILAFSGFLIMGFASFLPRAGKFLTPAMRVPNWAYYTPALIGCMILALVALSRIVTTLRGRDPLQAGPVELEDK